MPPPTPAWHPVGAGNSAVVVDRSPCGPMLSPRVPHHVPIPGPRMERETPGQRPRPNYGHPQPALVALPDSVIRPSAWSSHCASSPCSWARSRRSTDPRVGGSAHTLLLAARGRFESLTGLLEPGGVKRGHWATERFPGQGVDGVEVGDTVGGNAVGGRGQGQFRGQASTGSRECCDYDRADAARDGVACEYQHWPVAAGCGGEPDLTAPHRPSRTSLQPAPSARPRSATVPRG